MPQYFYFVLKYDFRLYRKSLDGSVGMRGGKTCT